MEDTTDNDAGVRGLTERLGYAFVRLLSRNGPRQVWRATNGADDVVIKAWAAAPGAGPPYALTAHRLLNEIEGPFARLATPRCLDAGLDDAAGAYVVMSFIEGTDFRHRWHYTKPGLAGGLGLEDRDIGLAVELMADLHGIAAEPLVAKGLRLTTPQAAVRLFEKRLGSVRDEGLLPAPAADAARTLVARWALERGERGALCLSNLDFRYLNLLQVSREKTAIIDWDDAQASVFETEHCIAYQWLFLWNRPDLQKELVRRARAAFDLDEATFRATLAMRAVIQIHTCRKSAELSGLHRDQTLAILSDHGFSEIWG